MKDSTGFHLILAILVFFIFYTILMFIGTISGIMVLIEQKISPFIIKGSLVFLFEIYIYIVVDFLFIKKPDKLSKESVDKNFDSGKDLTLRFSIKKMDLIGLFQRHFNIFAARIYDIISKLKIIAADNNRIAEDLAQ